MAKKKKVVIQKKAADTSRLPVDKDAYLPFEDIKKVVPKKIEQKPTPIPKPTRKEPRVVGYDPHASFGDILSAWEATGELGGVTKKMKSHSKVTVEKTFAEILSEWEGEKVAAKEKKAETIKKSTKYVPKKDFGSLLDQYDGVTPKKDRSVSSKRPAIKTVDEKLLPTSVEMKQALEDKVEADEEKKGDVSWSFADTYRAWNSMTDEQKAMEKAKSEKKEERRSVENISTLRAMEPQVTLDLHGMTVQEAEMACSEFLKESAAKKLQKICIITGKGLHNDQGYSLLKEAALSQIRLSGVVREAYSPKACYGGSGAIWILLKGK